MRSLGSGTKVERRKQPHGRLEAGSPPPGPAARPNTILRQWTGPLSADLILRPGDFGLGQVPARLRPDATTRSVCGFCSTGCSLDVHLQAGQAVNLTPTAEYPVNLGMACPKGWEALTCLGASDRATTPLLRNARTGELAPTDWPAALRAFTLGFKGLMDQHGPESVALLSTGQICTEEMAFVGALWKFGFGALHCDSNTRQCMATSHTAYKQSFGFDAPPYTYADFEQSDTLVFIGSNLCIAHPIMWQRVLRNPRRPEIIVVDPRKTETALNATQHLALRPKSDLTLLYGIAHLLAQNGWVDHGFIQQNTTHYEAFAEFVRQFTPDKVAAETGLTVGELYRFAETIHRGRAVSFWWTMGVNQGHESTRTAQAIINLALMTGNLGRPGTGANSITGQCNAMGSRLFANATSLLGGRDFLNTAHREDVARVLDLPVERIPNRNSLAYDQIIQGIAAGQIKGLWVIATNSLHSWIDSARLAEVFNRLEFLVVQDMFTTTDTARRAHLILPAAGWGEKEGTFINSERRFGHVKKVARAPGQALSDFNIFRLIAEAWGCADMFKQWTSPAAAFQIIKRLSAGQPCDISGIEDYQHLDAQGGIQWPWTRISSNPAQTSGALTLIPALSLRERENRSPSLGETETDKSSGPLEESSSAERLFPLPAGEGQGEGERNELCNDVQPARERRLFADGKFFTPDGRAKFFFDPPRPVGEPPDRDFPFVLLTGRGSSAQWHTNTRTGKSAVLRTLYPAEPWVEIHPHDAVQLRLEPNARVALISRRGRVELTARITPTIQSGQVFVPMHYEIANQLTRAEFDPHSRQPSYKHCAVRLEAVPT